MWKLDVENVAGIRSGEAKLEPGSNAIRGTNWQGKSSFVTAIETVMGTEATLTEGESRGRVELSTGENDYAVELTRENDTVRREGDPYLSTERARVAASLYAFFDDTNEIRRAVRNHQNLESLLTRPIDFENIDERIATLSRERDRIESELERARAAAKQLPKTQEKLTGLRKELEKLEERRESIADTDDGDVSDHRDELSRLKAERDSVLDRIERLENAIERTRGRLEEKRTELADLDVEEADEDLEAEIERREDRVEKLKRDAELLQSIYAPTKRLLDEGRLDLITDVERELTGDHVSCWLCGNATTPDAIETHLEGISERVTDLRERKAESERKVETLRERRDEIRGQRRRERKLEEAIADLEANLEDRIGNLETSRSRLETLEEEIETLSETVEETDARLTDLDSEIKYTRARIEDVRGELADLEERAEERDSLRERHDELSEEIAGLRDRKAELKRRTREAFDEAIRDVISLFDVGFEMVRLTQQFDLVVARDGRKAELDALSEGELELLGIVTALAGHEAFDVGDDVPVMLLDGLGGLADDNLETLVEYLEDRVEYLVFTTYPENSFIEGNTIDPDGWEVVTPEAEAD